VCGEQTSFKSGTVKIVEIAGQKRSGAWNRKSARYDDWDNARVVNVYIGNL